MDFLRYLFRRTPHQVPGDAIADIPAPHYPHPSSSVIEENIPEQTSSIEWPNPEDVPNTPYKGKRMISKVTKVYDGDTITVIIPIAGGEFMKGKIRVMGVDAPELKVKRNDSMTLTDLEMADLEEQAGAVVRDKVSKLLLNKEVEIRLHSPDKYGGRWVGAVYLTTQRYETLTEYLLANGLGKPYGGGKKGEWTREELRSIVDSATPKPRRK